MQPFVLHIILVNNLSLGKPISLKTLYYQFVLGIKKTCIIRALQSVNAKISFNSIIMAIPSS